MGDRAQHLLIKPSHDVAVVVKTRQPVATSSSLTSGPGKLFSAAMESCLRKADQLYIVIRIGKRTPPAADADEAARYTLRHDDRRRYGAPPITSQLRKKMCPSGRSDRQGLSARNKSLKRCAFDDDFIAANTPAPSPLDATASKTPSFFKDDKRER